MFFLSFVDSVSLVLLFSTANLPGERIKEKYVESDFETHPQHLSNIILDIMSTLKCRKIINNIKDELRNQVSLWDYQLMHDRAMNLALQRKAESAIEKSKIIQKIRLMHAEKLLRDFDSKHSRRKDIEKEIQTYWSAILPDIKDAVESFREINNIRKFYDQIHELEIPDELDTESKNISPQDSEPEIKSIMTYDIRGSNDSTGHNMPSSVSHSKTLTTKSKSGNKFSSRKDKGYSSQMLNSHVSHVH